MSDRTAEEPRYPVRAVISRTGLSADVLRAWERRYGAVHPRRTPGGQRLYSDADVARLTLMRRATQAGHSIGEIARLDLPALEDLVAPAATTRAAAGQEEQVALLVRRALSAMERLDAPGLDALLRRGALALGGTVFVDQVISRLLRAVGDRWHAGSISPAHEHLASVTVRGVLAWLIAHHAPSPHAPILLVSTILGELHEFGAMLVAAAAAEEGWRVVYLGVSLPAADLAVAATQVGARAVALSAVYGEPATVEAQLQAVREALPRDVALLAGGAAAEGGVGAAAAAGAPSALRAPEVRLLPDIRALRQALHAMHGYAPQGGLTAAAPPAPAPSPS